MSTVKYEKDGVVMATSSSVPGISFLPPGFDHTDAVPITQDEFKDILDNHESATKPEPTKAELLEQLNQLTAAVKAMP